MLTSAPLLITQKNLLSNQQIANHRLAVLHREQQRCFLRLILGVDLRAVLQQELHDGLVAEAGRDHQPCHPVLPGVVDLRALLDEQLDAVDAACLAGVVDRRAGLLVPLIDIALELLQYHAHVVRASELARDHERRGLDLVALLHVRSQRDEVLQRLRSRRGSGVVHGLAPVEVLHLVVVLDVEQRLQDLPVGVDRRAVQRRDLHVVGGLLRDGDRPRCREARLGGRVHAQRVEVDVVEAEAAALRAVARQVAGEPAVAGSHDVVDVGGDYLVHELVVGVEDRLEQLGLEVELQHALHAGREAVGLEDVVGEGVVALLAAAPHLDLPDPGSVGVDRVEPCVDGGYAVFGLGAEL